MIADVLMPREWVADGGLSNGALGALVRITLRLNEAASIPANDPVLASMDAHLPGLVWAGYIAIATDGSIVWGPEHQSV